MKQFTHSVAALTVTAMLAGGSAAWALQEPMPHPAPAPQEAPNAYEESDTATGELVDVDTEAMTLTIKGADDKNWTFKFTSETEVEGGQESVSGLATKAGSTVTVHFKGEGEERTAKKIVIAD